MNPFSNSYLNLPLRRPESSWVEPDKGSGDSVHRYIGKPLGRKQVFVVIILIAVGFFVIVGRAFKLQIINGDYYLALAEGNRTRIHNVIAPRGLIYDRLGRPMTENIPRMSVALIPFDVPNDNIKKEKLFNEVGLSIGMTANEIFQIWNNMSPARKKSIEPYLIKSNLPLDEGLRLKLISSSWPGVSILITPRRTYKSIVEDGFKSLSHILGYVSQVTDDDLMKKTDYSSEDIIGRNGLELIYENDLKGKNGKREVEVNALGEEQKLFTETKTVPGKNIWLTIDLDLQNETEKALVNGLKKANVKKGTAIVLDPSSGEILAMASLPSFDSNKFTLGLSNEDYKLLINDEDRPLFNRAIQGQYPSGSTIKPIIAAAALEEKIINSKTTFSSTGGIRVGKWFFPDWKAGGHGPTNVTLALAQSVNTFFYTVGGGYNDFVGLGIARIKKYAEKFGLGLSTNVDLPGEAIGFIPTPEWKKSVKKEDWYIGNTYYTAIGQGDVLVTPLQVATYTAAFANGGILYQPHFLLEKIDNETSIKNQPIVKNQQVVSKESIDIVRLGLREAVVAGSAKYLSLLPITVAGKTGTAEIGGDHKPHAWFTGFAPFENPKIVVTVILEEAGEGSSYAVPVASEIIKWWAEQRLEI